jgi:hypothetical protein
MTHEIVVHKINMGDVEDPDLFVAEPIYKWQQTEQGKFIMENSKEQPMWKRNVDHSSFGYVYTIHAWLDDKDLVYWKLKYE